jgi:hypothetical protein
MMMLAGKNMAAQYDGSKDGRQQLVPFGAASLENRRSVQ